MQIVNKYNYKELARDTKADGTRTYVTPEGIKVPSVTTVLSATKDMTHLHAWRKRMGEAKAAEIVKTSTTHGSKMHKLLENYILKGDAPTGNPFTVAMAKEIITKGLPKLDEVWGVEVPLYADGLYGGTTDLIGIHEGAPAIVDFKNARSWRKPEWVVDYGIQTAAYGMAHNEMFGTDIKKGVVMLCTQDVEYQEFIFEGKDFEEATAKWLQRLEEYYAKQ
jgi:hypothetical protein